MKATDLGARTVRARAMLLHMMAPLVIGLALAVIIAEKTLAPAAPPRGVVLDGWWRGHGGPCAIPVRVYGAVHVVEASPLRCATIAPGDTVDLAPRAGSLHLP